MLMLSTVWLGACDSAMSNGVQALIGELVADVRSGAAAATTAKVARLRRDVFDFVEHVCQHLADEEAHWPVVIEQYGVVSVSAVSSPLCAAGWCCVKWRVGCTTHFQFVIVDHCLADPHKRLRRW